MKTETFEYGIYPEDTPEHSGYVWWLNYESVEWASIPAESLEEGDVWCYGLPGPEMPQESKSIDVLRHEYSKKFGYKTQVLPVGPEQMTKEQLIKYLSL